MLVVENAVADILVVLVYRARLKAAIAKGA